MWYSTKYGKWQECKKNNDQELSRETNFMFFRKWDDIFLEWDNLSFWWAIQRVQRWRLLDNSSGFWRYRILLTFDLNSHPFQTLSDINTTHRNHEILHGVYETETGFRTDWEDQRFRYRLEWSQNRFCIRSLADFLRSRVLKLLLGNLLFFPKNQSASFKKNVQNASFEHKFAECKFQKKCTECKFRT